MRERGDREVHVGLVAAQESGTASVEKGSEWFSGSGAGFDPVRGGLEIGRWKWLAARLDDSVSSDAQVGRGAALANVQGIASIRAVRLERKLGKIPPSVMDLIRQALRFALDL